jgi:uncharacterized protein (TIGR02646 family)
MRAITKGREPSSLARHRAGSHSDFDNYAAKDELRAALVKEQCGLCCYCMGRVFDNASKMKIEHWRSKSRYPHLQLTYQNLLAACLGGEGQPEELQHCDTRKGVRDLKFNPAYPEHQIDQRIRFELNGTITSDGEEFDTQLNEVLGLNLPLLKNRRKSVLTGMMEWWNTEKDRLHRSVPRERLERELARRLGQNDEILTPSDPVEAWWLKQRLARSQHER